MAPGFYEMTKRDECTRAGGVYARGGVFDPGECWTEDGTRRIFPEEWK